MNKIICMVWLSWLTIAVVGLTYQFTLVWCIMVALNSFVFVSSLFEEIRRNK